nr:DUF3253 domain-containing protein [Patulibacter sp. SYSU D01012]
MCRICDGSVPRVGPSAGRRYARHVPSVPDDDRIRATIDALLGARRPGATICPSDAARALRPDGDWRALMDDVRRVAAAEHDAGRLEVRQGGARVEPATARGPIRLGRP